MITLQISTMAIFSFYNIDEWTATSGTDWIGIIFTALLSGLVAWIAAYIQIALAAKQQKFTDQKNAFDLISILVKNLKRGGKAIDAHLGYLEKSVADINTDKPFTIPDNTINISALRSIEKLDYTTMYRSIKLSNPSDEDLILTAHSSVEGFLENYVELRKFHSEKFLEYNSLINRLNSANNEVAILVQKLIFSTEFYKYKNELEKQPTIDKNVFRKKHLTFHAIYSIELETAKYQNKESTEFSVIDAYMSNLWNIVKDSETYFPSVELAQAILKSRIELKTMEVFFSTFVETYRSHFEVNKKHKENIDACAELVPIAPKPNKKWLLLLS